MAALTAWMLTFLISAYHIADYSPRQRPRLRFSERAEQARYQLEELAGQKGLVIFQFLEVSAGNVLITVHGSADQPDAGPVFVRAACGLGVLLSEGALIRQEQFISILYGDCIVWSYLIHPRPIAVPDRQRPVRPFRSPDAGVRPETIYCEDFAETPLRERHRTPLPGRNHARIELIQGR